MINHVAQTDKRTIKGTMAQAFQTDPSWTLISQGAEARLWKIPDYLPLAQAAVAKERFRKSYRHPILDERLTKSRCKAEAKCLVRARRGGVLCPAVWGVEPPVLYIQFLEGVTVRQHLEQINSDLENGITNDAKRKSLAKDIGTVVAKLHNAGIVHGDLTTSNMMLESSKVFLIDFGLARVSQNPEEFAVDIYVLERALISTHPELEETSFLKEILTVYKALGTKSDATLQRLSAVRLRGRKRECFG